MMVILWLFASDMPPALRFFLLGLGIFGVCAAALLLWAGLVYLALSYLRRRQQMVLLLRLTSASNIETAFRLQTDLGDLNKAFIALWLHESGRLFPKKLEKVAYVEEEHGRAGREQPPAAANRSSSHGLKATWKQFTGKTRFLNGMVSLFAGISSALASILPHPLNAPFVRFANTIRGGQSDVDAALSRPRAIGASARQIQSNTAQLSKMAGGQVGGKPAGQSMGGERDQVAKQLRRVVQVEQVVDTPPVSSGQPMAVQLVLRPLNPFRNRSGMLTVSSQQLEHPDFPASELLKPQRISEPFTIQRPPPLWLALFTGFVLVVFSLNAWAAFRAIQWLLWVLK